MTGELLSREALNRATLHRQLLLGRSDSGILDAVEHLVGLQAQVPLDPYTALWSRLEGFDPERMGRHLEDRELVRIVAMRGTIHLLSADDCLVLRPLVQPVLDQELARHPDHRHIAGVDLSEALAYVGRLVADGPMSIPSLKDAIAEQFDDLDPASVIYACRNRLAFVQTPPRGVWGRRAQITYSTAEAWLGRSVVTDPSIDEVVVRYLGAFGPALVADVAAWCRLTAMGEVLDRLRPRLRTFRDEKGREMFDLPDAPRPDPGTPAPTRVLPEYDNVLLSHADRSRFTAPRNDGWTMSPRGPVKGTVLHDGFLSAGWHVQRDKQAGRATFVLEPVGKHSGRAVSAMIAEARRYLSFAEAAWDHDVEVVGA